MAGTDCGFATFASYLSVHPDITWAKLHAMTEGAALASQELY
jgi:5-methyltetrahydropteroyltriglutamate--homocysteine methyltransferase